MAIRIFTVARTSLEKVTPELLREAIGARLAVIAARYPSSDEETPQQLLAELRVEPEGGSPGTFGAWTLTYSPNARPIRVERHVGKAWEKERRAFYDEVGPGTDEVAVRLRGLLTEAKESVSFQLADIDSHGVAWAIAMSGAAALARAGDGLVRADREGWLEPQGKDVATLLSFA